MLLDVIDHRVTLRATEAIAEEFHDACIGIHRGERLAILVTPWAQADAVTGQCRKRAHRCTSLCLNKCDGESDRVNSSFSRGTGATTDRVTYLRKIEKITARSREHAGAP
jgi:hypothetical protein